MKPLLRRQETFGVPSENHNIDTENNLFQAKCLYCIDKSSHCSIEYLTTRIKDLEKENKLYIERIEQLQNQNEQLMGVVVQSSHHDVMKTKEFIKNVEDLVKDEASHQIKGNYRYSVSPYETRRLKT